MRIPKRGEKGFTLIELLIVVAILGVLAAVIIPNVGRFLGRGEAEARRTEYHNISTAVTAMMVDNGLATIPTPISLVANRTNDMSAFPDTASVAGSANKLTDAAGTTFVDGIDPLGDKNGYLLYGHDMTAGDNQVALVNYVNFTTTVQYYTCDSDGTVHQYDAAGIEYTY